MQLFSKKSKITGFNLKKINNVTLEFGALKIIKIQKHMHRKSFKMMEKCQIDV
jgi:hypothetical protein